MTAGICILAGGLSSRMKRNKAGLRLGRRTLLGHVRRTAEGLGLKVCVVRKDMVRRCGPLGGIYTGLKTSRHETELFLSCDMPFVKPELLRELLEVFAREQRAVFVERVKMVGFPLVLSVGQVGMVETEIGAGRFSLQNLARRLKAKRLRLKGPKAQQLFNVNTPEDWKEAQKRRAELPL